jgi:hypothetical protein
VNVVKFSVSFDPEVAKLVRQRANRAGMSVSGWLAMAAADRARNEGLGELLDEWEAEHGAPTEEMLREADIALGFGEPPEPRR